MSYCASMMSIFLIFIQDTHEMKVRMLVRISYVHHKIVGGNVAPVIQDCRNFVSLGGIVVNEDTDLRIHRERIVLDRSASHYEAASSRRMTDHR